MRTYLDQALRNALDKLGIRAPGEIPFTRTKDPKFGDLATNIALIVAKSIGQNPRVLAQSIADGMDTDTKRISKIEVAGGGFINFFFSPDYFHERVREIVRNEAAYGRSDTGTGMNANVEFVSANPTGPLSVGHGRQAVLGDVLCRILENSGYHVTREYYYNNAGAQMKKLGESVRIRYLQALGEDVVLPDKYYEGEYIRDIAEQIQNQHGDSWKTLDAASFLAFAEPILFANIRDVLSRVGIQFDVYFNEDTLYRENRLQTLISRFHQQGITYEKDGATWLRTGPLEYRHGPKPDVDKVIVKSTGEPTYRLPDMAYHITKFERGYDRIIDVFGADHVAEYPDVLAALGALGYDTARVTIVVHQFVTLSKEGEILKMSKRKANFVTIDELVDALGSDVFRYFLIMRSHHSHLQFDLELARQQTMENPVYYVQNAHARICSIEAKAREKGISWEDREVDLSVLTSAEERDIMQKLDEFPALLRRLAEVLEVHPVTTYLEELAGLYHRYQTAGKKNDAIRVVTANEVTTRARLWLCRATRIVLQRGLDILGVSAPTYMEQREESDEELK